MDEPQPAPEGPEEVLAETPADTAEPAEPAAQARPVDRWRHNTASGAIAASFALGLQQVFEPQHRQTVPIEQEVPDKPVEPGSVELDFNPTDARATSIVIRRPPRPEE